MTHNAHRSFQAGAPAGARGNRGAPAPAGGDWLHRSRSIAAAWPRARRMSRCVRARKSWQLVVFSADSLLDEGFGRLIPILGAASLARAHRNCHLAKNVSAARPLMKCQLFASPDHLPLLTKIAELGVCGLRHFLFPDIIIPARLFASRRGGCELPHTWRCLADGARKKPSAREYRFGKDGRVYAPVRLFIGHDAGKRIGLQDYDAPALERDPSVLDPNLQLLVDHLARHADDLAQVFLRHRDLALRLGGLCQSQQRLDQPASQIEEHEVLDLLAGAPQACAQHLHELYRDFRIAAQQRDEVPPLDDHELAIGKRHRIGGARLTVEQGDLAEDLAFSQVAEYGALPGRG